MTCLCNRALKKRRKWSGDGDLIRLVETEEKKRREGDNNLIDHIVTEEEKTKNRLKLFQKLPFNCSR